MFSKPIGLYNLILPFTMLVDLLIVNLLAYYLPINFKEPILFHSYITFGWLLISSQNGFYKIYRYSKVTYLARLVFIQFVFFFLALYAFIGFFKQPVISRLNLGLYFLLVSVSISLLKFLNYYLMMKYRSRIKSGIRKVVVIGDNKKIDQLIEVLDRRTDYGYRFRKKFNPSSPAFSVQTCVEYISNEKIDELYCSVDELNDSQLEDLIHFADNNLVTLKFIPDNKNIFAKKLKFEYLDYIPVLSLRDIPLHSPINAFFKRAFDIFFALLVIVLLLSWLTPLLALIITLESKGPVFFRQKRNGVDNQEFFCYKFRSMTPNQNADESSATKNDMRVTRIGRIIRRTSIDELPQFYNVLFGTMSVVGPRPHMVKHTSEFADRIDKFMVRHFVKPGITGLAQVRGYRGEIEKDADIQNRIKFDIFYIENWSMFLDLKIIVQTVLNIFRKEEKAY